MTDRNDIQRDTEAGNTPVWYGEFSLATQFNATDDFLREWADAQKLVYSQSAGWLVCLSAECLYGVNLSNDFELSNVVLELQD